MMTAIQAEKANRKADADRKDLTRRLNEDAEAIRASCNSLAGFVREAWHVV